MTPLNEPQPPSQQEVTCYYYGLPSRPRLVARSSSTPWKLQYDRWPIGKMFSHRAEHLVDAWNSTEPLQTEILKSLEGISWTAVDILRIGYERVSDFTGEKFPHVVTLFISVEPESTPYPLGYAVVQKCRQILERYGIIDVEVGMKEGKMTRCVSPATAPITAPQLSSSPLDVPIDENALLSQFTGLLIAAYDSPDCEGTKCLYLRCRNTSKVFLLTCRHVVLGDWPADRDYQHDANQHPRTVVQPGNSTLKYEREDVEIGLRGYEREINLLANDPSQKAAERVEKKQELKRKFLAAAEKLNLLDELETRIIGHVVFAPKYGLGIAPSGKKHLRDWALVELHPEKHEAAGMALENSIFLGENARSKITSAAFAEMSQRDEKCERWGLWPDPLTCTFLATGIIHETEMLSSASISPPDGTKAMIVAKHGRGTKLTIGVVNEAKSFTRELVGGTSFISEELCIIGHRPREQRRYLFSGPGDSGSCVCDMMGRVGAMLTRGVSTGDGDEHDTTYATPLEWLLNDIRKHGFDVELV